MGLATASRRGDVAWDAGGGGGWGEVWFKVENGVTTYWRGEPPMLPVPVLKRKAESESGDEERSGEEEGGVADTGSGEGHVSRRAR